MSLEILGLLLDVLVLGFLGAMIFYALRLSKSLNDFRSHRQEFDTIIIKLMSSIDQAERSIQNLKQVSARESEDLNRVIKQSRALSEELQIINEAGESMAKRLEELAERNRKIAQNADLTEPPSERYKPYRPPQVDASAVKVQNQPTIPSEPKDFPSFMIKDPDYPPIDRLEDRLGNKASNDYPKSQQSMPDKLQSQAERDLYNALRGLKGRGE